MDARSHRDGCADFDDRPAPADAGLCRSSPPVSQPGPDAHGLWPVVPTENRSGHHMLPHHGRGMPIVAR